VSPRDAGGHPGVEQAEGVLRELGLGAARVEVLGAEGATVAVSAPARERARLIGPEGAELSRRLKALGFRYVALDLGPAA
jgi:PP-loop superfamily ATP-utilizing enzyme